MPSQFIVDFGTQQAILLLLLNLSMLTFSTGDIPTALLEVDCVSLFWQI